MQAFAEIGVGKRVTILDTIGTLGDGSDGQSLRGQNVNAFPDACLFYVRDSNRMYRLKKNQSVAIAEDTTGMDNVVSGIGSSAAAGRFVALVQMNVITLGGGGAGSIAGWDVNPDGWFHCTYVTFGTSPGFLRASATSETTVTVNSSDGESTGGTVFVTYYETPEGS